jgi:hypothetical protein
MKKIILLFAFTALTIVVNKSFAQFTAMQLSGLDCNGNNHDLFADLNAGKAAILFFYMPNCGSCPPPAQKIQKMANNILANHPNTITAYAMPFENTTTCSGVSSWVSTNNLPLFMPYDSGVTQVANYGGFGMPTVVLLGGTNHRVMFSTLSFSTSDTTIMRDSILAMLGVTSNVINDAQSELTNFSVYPNPSNTTATISFSLNQNSNVTANLLDVTGKLLTEILNENNAIGTINKTFNTATLPNGIYLIKINANGKLTEQKLNVAH